MGRRLGIEPAPQRPGQQAMNGRRSRRRRRDRRASSCRRRRRRAIRFAVAARRQSERSGHSSPSARAQEHHAVAPLPQRLRPRQPVEADAVRCLPPACARSRRSAPHATAARRARRRRDGARSGRAGLRWPRSKAMSSPASMPSAKCVLDLRQRQTGAPTRCAPAPRCRQFRPPRETARGRAPMTPRHWRAAPVCASRKPPPAPRLLAMRSG